MGIVLALMREIGMMLLIIALGMYTKKAGIFNDNAAKMMSDFLVAIVMPILLIDTLQRDKIPELMPGFWAMLGMSAFILSMSAAVSMLVFRKNPVSQRYKVDRLAVVLPNCGFMGIPLITATLGEQAVMYCPPLLGMFQIIMWGWAVPTIEGKKMTAKKIFVNPSMISFTVSLLLFLFEIRLPKILLSFTSQISALNTPISMLMIGMLLTGVKPRDVFLTKSIYKTVFWRNLAFPSISLFIIYIFNLTAHFGKMFSMAFVIMIACSSAASVILLPIRARVESAYSAQVVMMSTLFSIITLPLVAFIAQKVL